MGECQDNVFSFLVFGGGIALIVCGIAVAKPNLHGINFVEGNCTITSATTIQDWDELPKCSCGKNCQEEFPCVIVYASFDSSVKGTSFDRGTLHNDYSALSDGCLVRPDCDSDFETNEVRVLSYFYDTVVPLVNDDSRYPEFMGENYLMNNPGLIYYAYVNYTNVSSFECWGYDNDIYIDHSYTALKAYLALGIPAGCMVLGVLLSGTHGSSSQREMVLGLIAVPFIIIGGILGAIAKCLGCHSCRRPSCSCCFKSRAGRGPDVEMSAERYRPRPRVSFSLSTTSTIRIEDPDRRDLDMAIELSLQQPYPSSVDPPRYTDTASSYPSAPTSIITAPADESPYTAIMDLPPPPSYNDVMASDAPTGYSSA